MLVRKDGATFWKADAGDSPEKPTTPCTAADAITLVKTEQKAVPKPGPITLRGRWTGVMHCDGEVPRLELYRKLAAYGTLTLTSHGADGWSWSFARTAKWFGREATTGEDGIARLADAMERGVLGAMQLVKQACSFRDTTRRAEVDPSWAEKHPPRHAPERPDPTDRLREPKPRKGRSRPKSLTPEPPVAAPAPSTYEERYEHAMRSVGPGNWGALIDLYASPKDTRTHRELAAWLDRYARTAEDALALLDGRDAAPEAGIRGDAYDEIARRLRFEPIEATSKPKPARKPRRPKAEASSSTAPPTAASDDQAAKDAQILALFKAALAEESP